MLISYGEIKSVANGREKEQSECECGIVFDENVNEFNIDEI